MAILHRLYLELENLNMVRGPIIVDRFCGDVFATQRRMRSQLLDHSIIRYKPARDLAAHMLLNIDDLPACWSLATSWLRVELDCHRVDAGFGRPKARDYYPGYAEAKDSNYDIPSFGGSAVYNRDPAMQAMWLGSRPLVFADIKQDRRVTPRLRQRMSGARTKSKFGGALRTQEGSYGLICADWTEHIAPQRSKIYDCFEQTVSDVLSPIIAIAKEIAEQAPKSIGGHQNTDDFAVKAQLFSAPLDIEILTDSEAEVARLVAQGLSYKEIARIRDRSFSTIDHQLRSIRKKIGVSSTSELVSLLAKVDHFVR